ncbi:hypothetical protein FAZ95_22340 [Trinickia violacea]|uniref:Cytosolic endo-beta-N-acetylglucosaminidase TIM barrel domain-containing protein n=1 Tax=Trinickia violacea TaxID=2571746 RepID=A0A4P8IXP7_9BURK|nr:hypothetical protein [Trinickia violacea]QCP51954.1 hypothetical protein FAZ95_22340 [Trinickia violacea]
MKKHHLFVLILAFLFSAQAGAANTFTWALDPAQNGAGYHTIQSVDPNNLAGYVAPSNTPLNTNLTRSWIGSSRTDTGAEFTAIYRTRAASNKTYPEFPATYNPVTFENWAFIRKMISFGGEAGSGAHISAPDPEWVTAAHSHGVKIYGVVYIDHDAGTIASVENLLGTYNGLGEGDKANYAVPVLDKLQALAVKLKLDGWLLNIEKGLDIPQNASQLRRVASNLFPVYKDQGVEFLLYVGRDDIYGIGSPQLFTDADIANFGNLGINAYGIENAIGIDPGPTNGIFPSNSKKTYLMYLDQVFTVNTPRNLFWSLRVDAAKATQCQYFNGSGVWPGFKAYAQAAYPVTMAQSTALCGGNPVSLATPIPTKILKITLPPAISVAPQTTNEACYDVCYYEFQYGTNGGIRETLTFNVPMIRLNTGTGLGDSPSYQDDALYSQYVPGVKWWNKRHTESGNFVWAYSFPFNNAGTIYTLRNPPDGVWCWWESLNDYSCKLPALFPRPFYFPSSDYYANASNTSIPDGRGGRFGPGYQHSTNPYDNWGGFPLLNLVMNVNLR